MQMLDSLRLRFSKYYLPRERGLTKGFTLLELLTVLFVLGLIAAIVTPNFPTLFNRLSFAMEREAFIRRLNELPISAMESNQDLILIGKIESSSTEESNVNENAFEIDGLDIATPYRSAAIKRANIILPDNWKVNIPEPIFFRSSGFCSGGRLIIEIGELRYTLISAPPYCTFTEELPR